MVFNKPFFLIFYLYLRIILYPPLYDIDQSNTVFSGPSIDETIRERMFLLLKFNSQCTYCQIGIDRNIVLHCVYDKIVSHPSEYKIPNKRPLALLIFKNYK